MYRRAVEEFERLKRLRHELPNEAILEAQPEPNETTCPPAKRTRRTRRSRRARAPPATSPDNPRASTPTANPSSSPRAPCLPTSPRPRPPTRSLAPQMPV
jgi:hypothetical protein